MKRHILLSLSLLAFSLFANAQSTINYSYYHGTESLAEWGTAKAETYNVAIRVDDASLVGKAVKSINIPIVTGASNATGYSAFLTKELKVSGGKAVADITSAEFEPAGEWTKVTFSEPYVIEAGGFYAGYTFTVKPVSTYDDENPLRLMVGSREGGFYFATSRTYRKWTDMQNSLNGCSPIQLEIEGNFLDNACGVVSVNDASVKSGDAFTVTATVANHGTKPVESLTCVYSLSNESVNETFDFNITLPEPIGTEYYGQTKEISFDIPEGKIYKGTYLGTLSITGINGVENGEAAITATNTVKVYDILPVKRPLMEEFTGTWCGYCPRGWVAMRVMNEKYPDRFIAVSYHNSDIMEIHSGSSDNPYPVTVTGFPYANLDRVHGTDPYYGDSDENMGIEALWKARCEVNVPANIDVEASITDNGMVDATAKVTFVEDVAECPYRIAYMVTADGLTGTTSDWMQHSYFSGAEGLGPEMDQFTQGESSQLLVYDDVLIANSEYNGIENSLPASVKEGEESSNSYQFALSEMVSTSGEYLVQDQNKLNVIALIVNPETGEIINAAKCRVQNNTSAITGITDNVSRNVEHIEYYDISGRKLSSLPGKGIYVKTVKYTDGTKNTVKIRK